MDVPRDHLPDSAPDAVVPRVGRPPVAPRAVRRAALFGVLAFVAAYSYGASRMIWAREADFEYFYKAGAWLTTHGGLDRRIDINPDGTTTPRGGIEWYLPVVHRMASAFSLLPFRLAGFVWLAANIVVVLATLRLIGRHLSGLPPEDWPVTQLVPFALCALFYFWEFQLNQVDSLTLLLLVASFVHWQEGKRAVSGFWLGLATLLKLTPALVIVWFVLKRQWRTVLVAGLTMIAYGPLGDALVFGPQQAMSQYREWLANAVDRGGQRGVVIHELEMDWRNQGLGAVLSRWLAPTNWALHFDNDPRIAPELPERFMNVADLPRSTVATIVVSILGASLLGLVWLARRPASDMTTWALRLEWALFVMAMLWFMPVMRRYHMIWVLPTVSLLCAALHYVSVERGAAPDRWPRIALAALLTLALAQLCLLYKVIGGTNIVEAAGTLLLSIVVLAIPVILLLRRLRRRPDYLPLDPYQLARRKEPSEPPATESSEAAHA